MCIHNSPFIIHPSFIIRGAHRAEPTAGGAACRPAADAPEAGPVGPSRKEQKTMTRFLESARAWALRWAAAMVVALLALAIWSNAAWGAAPSRPASGPAGAAPAATPGQDFQDVFPSDPFYPYL